MIMIDPLYVVSGFGVGVLVGMTGVGGGSLMTPLLILLFGVIDHRARLVVAVPLEGGSCRLTLVGSEMLLMILR